VFAQGIREREHAFVKRRLLVFRELTQCPIESGAPAIDKPCGDFDSRRGKGQADAAAIELAGFPGDQTLADKAVNRFGGGWPRETNLIGHRPGAVPFVQSEVNQNPAIAVGQMARTGITEGSWMRLGAPPDNRHQTDQIIDEGWTSLTGHGL
jgi:hypothetical protein